ncbi:YheC/YheD family protein [Thermoactinomyces mirandus]|uniref:YheC/YheD family protein n=1 Tax=Thermoactinomyces mirandus TaxID=2756294 RepID=A0A7W1XTK5_9BACL|nr:YheC/YheD family protein [Thermoactinomyces mirandus]MBA4602897.1 YheC/YheD family protein [Thermoactinomyces mirandus]
MKKLPYQQIASKTLKTMVLSRNGKISPHIPETKWYNYEQLKQMLHRHSAVFIKPDKGGGGAGTVRVTKLGSRKVELHTLNSRKVIDARKLPFYLKSFLNPRRHYIIQQWIDLGKINGRPFDLRVHLQKPLSSWQISGVCAKIAAPGKIVTNHCKGGQPVEAPKALYQVAAQKKQTIFLMRKIYNLSKEVAKTLNVFFPGLRELGIDLGVDKKLGIWIFEVNTRPDFKMFRVLEDLHMYDRIRKTHRFIV